MKIRPITFRAASAFVTELHRHNKAPRGHKFSIAVVNNEGRTIGVAMVGRPVARHLDDGITAEINRTCTDGSRNVNSMLYGAAIRACKAMGYSRVITYTQENESGASLRAAGFVKVKNLPARKSWAESSIALKNIRDPVGNGGVPRTLWEVFFAGKQREETNATAPTTAEAQRHREAKPEADLQASQVHLRLPDL